MQTTRGIQTAREADNEINLTPMLDVVFILLIFFVVTASFLDEVGLDIDAPAQSEAPPDDVDPPLVVRISRDNEILPDGRSLDPRSLRANLSRAAAGGGPRLLIEADLESSNRMLVRVMDAARLAGVDDIAIADGRQAFDKP